jgi:gluconolactonase
MEERMRTLHLGMVAACAAMIAVPVAISTSIAQTPPNPTTPPPPAPQMPPSIPAAHVTDLMTAQGSSAFNAQWRTMEAKIVDAKPIPGAMPQYKTAYDISPKAGDVMFDDSKWPVIEAKDLSARRSGGHVAFIWYRTNLTIPARVGDFDTTGAKAVLTVLVDDYAEVWVNGQMPRRAGYPSPATIQGFNMPNRVVLSESVKPGDRFQVAVFGINGPISVAPANTVWFREARLEFYR